MNSKPKDASRTSALEAERELIFKMLRQTHGDRESAEILGISDKALFHDIKEHSLDKASEVMTSSAFYEEGSKLLTRGAFEFVLDNALKLAGRSQNFLTLLAVETRREWEGMIVTADEGTMQQMAQIIGREMRGTDLFGHVEKGALAIVLLDCDFDHSARVIDRLVSRIEDYEFTTALRIAVGAACCPTHAVDADSLKHQAMSRPIVTWRGGRSLADQN